jgi:hypothetical protein
MSNVDWTKAGFSTPGTELTPRLIMSLCGLEKTGKTHLALSAPGPISYLSLDFGDEGVIEKFVPNKKIYKAEFKIPAARGKGKDREGMKDQAEEIWEDFKEKYLFSLLNARTVIVDTETEAWELIRLARFGKVDQVKPIHYGPVNREYKETMIKAAYEANANVILLQRLKKEWLNDKATGNYEQAGNSGIPFDVQVNARTYIDTDGRFALYIDNCRQNALLRGTSLSQEECEFWILANRVMPTVSPAVWMS